jgi:hypothetical protein
LSESTFKLLFVFFDSRPLGTEVVASDTDDPPNHVKLLHIIARAQTHEIGVIGVLLSSHGMSQMLFNAVVSRIINK